VLPWPAKAASLFLFICPLGIGLWGQSAPGPRLKALVIGNARYRFLPPIPAARAGADAMSGVLGDLHFDVVSKRDLTSESLSKAIQGFIQDLRPDEVCLVYYSGYGIQETDNYLVPTDFDPQVKGKAYGLAYAVGRLQNLLDDKKLALKIFFIEAGWESDRLEQRFGARGLASPQGDQADTVLVFDAAPNKVVPVSGEIGSFTRALVGALQKPGLNLTEIVQEVQKEVSAASRGEQQPYPVGGASFYFIPPPPPKPVIVLKDIWPKQGSVAWNKDHQEYVYIPKGSFLMGCVPSAERDCEDNEKPQHPVEINEPFWLGETEVEVEAYRYFVKQVIHGKMPKAPMWDGGWKVPGYPIVYVTWEEAQSYCAWAGGRLPTEAEWEYAARAGSDNQVFPFPDMKQSRARANFLGKAGYDQYEGAAPVKKFDPNNFGLFDMAGNVWEWVQDFYSPLYYKDSPNADPRGPASGKAHVARGGSYDSDPVKHLRLSYRAHFEGSANHVGFRCLLPDTPETRSQFNKRAGQ